MESKNQKKIDALYFEPILVRDNRDPEELANIIVSRATPSKGASVRSADRKRARRGFIATRLKKQASKQQPKLVLEFGGMSPDKQYKIAAELGKRQEIKSLEGLIEVKDGPFSYSAECLRVEIFGE